MMGSLKRSNAGFTLIELMIVVAIIAIISSIAVPKLMSTRLSANESAAISTLRTVSSAQAQLQSSGSIDTDADGAGEYGYFGELSGVKPMRIAGAGGAAMGVPGTDELKPAIMSFAFGAVTGSAVVRQGYHFQMFLPDGGAGGGGAILGLPEAPGGGAVAGSFPNPNNCEVLWCCYAWPTDHNHTGNRAFFINQEGELLQCANRGATPYDGTTNTPGFGEAFTTNDMGSSVRIGVVGGADGTLWTPIQI